MVEQSFRWIGDPPPEIPVFAFPHRPILVAQQQCGSRVLWASAEMRPAPCEVGWCMSISRVGRSRSPAYAYLVQLPAWLDAVLGEPCNQMLTFQESAAVLCY